MTLGLADSRTWCRAGAEIDELVLWAGTGGESARVSGSDAQTLTLSSQGQLRKKLAPIRNRAAGFSDCVCESQSSANQSLICRPFGNKGAQIQDETS